MQHHNHLQSGARRHWPSHFESFRGFRTEYRKSMTVGIPKVGRKIGFSRLVWSRVKLNAFLDQAFVCLVDVIHNENHFSRACQVFCRRSQLLAEAQRCGAGVEESKAGKLRNDVKTE